MCATCGCAGDPKPSPTPAHEHSHGHSHAHPHLHEHSEPAHVLSLEQKILARNDEQAQRNRRWLRERGMYALNLVSSPGAGKTALLERTIRDLGGVPPLQVIEGDQETDHDARRIRATGCPAIQLNTGTGCHLDATMIERVLPDLAPLAGSVLMIENVGNLVCPALFDLGEDAKVVVASVTEGEDKPVKYPHMFRAASLVLLNKVDLLPYVPFEPDRFRALAEMVNPGLRILPLSATRGDGMGDWYRWLRDRASHGAS